MTFIRKRSVMAFAGLAACCIAYAQDPVITFQDYTSTIAVTDVDGNRVSQQISGPFGIPTLIEGEDVLVQGLFASLTGIGSLSTSGISDVFAESADFALRYDAVAKALRVTVPDQTQARLFIVDTSGRNVAAQNVSDSATSVDVSSLTPGTYMAGVASNNKIKKSIKFIVK